MKYISLSLCYPYQGKFGVAIYSNVAVTVSLEKLKEIAENYDKVDFSGVNNVSVMLENSESEHGRIFSTGGYSNKEGLFVHEYQ